MCVCVLQQEEQKEKQREDGRTVHCYMNERVSIQTFSHRDNSLLSHSSPKAADIFIQIIIIYILIKITIMLIIYILMKYICMVISRLVL